MFLTVCESSSLLNLISLVKSLLEIITTIIPIVLILMITFDLSKLVIDVDEKTRHAITKKVINRSIAAVAVFFIPTLVNVFTNRLGQQSYSQMTCWTNATTEKIARYTAKEEEAKALEQEKITIAKGEAAIERALVEQEREKARKIAEEKAASVKNRIKPYFQTDYPHLPYNPYNTAMCGSMAGCACGLTSVAVVATAFNGEAGNDPVSVRNWICKTGSCTDTGTAWAGMISYLRQGGLNVTEVQYTNSPERVMNSLRSGRELIIPLYHNNGSCDTPFTTGGHYFVLTGIATNGEIEIVQVSSRRQTAQTWPISTITKCMNGAIYVSKGA